MMKDLILAIEVGTGNARAALVDAGNGAILEISAGEYDEIVAAFGWAEQCPSDLWSGMATALRIALGRHAGAAEWRLPGIRIVRDTLKNKKRTIIDYGGRQCYKEYIVNRCAGSAAA